MLPKNMCSVISILSVKNMIPEFQRLLPHKKFHKVENAETDQQLRKSEIIIADYDLIFPYIYDLPNVKWMQGTWAGVNILMKGIRPSQPLKYPVSRFTGKHFGFLMSEYVLSNIVNFERDVAQISENQKLKKWSQSGKISEFRSVFDLTVGILGVGNIGNKIAITLNSMGAKVFGFGRRPAFDLEENPHIAMYFTKSTLPQLLEKCDYIVNVLPDTEETRGLLNGNILESCKTKGAVFINVGRGSVISEECLVNALRNKWISGAILDVFEKEPLNAESLLWDMPNVIITPHVSAVSRAKDVAEQFKENLKCFEQNLPIPATVDFSKGY